MIPACTGPTGIWCRPDAFGGEEGVGAGAPPRAGAGAERMAERPAAVVEPGPRVAARRRAVSPQRSASARSSRIAGACAAPTEGNAPSTQA